MKCTTTKSLHSKFRVFSILGLLTYLYLAPTVMAEEVLSDEWKFNASVNMWGAGIGGESATGGDIDIDFSDIIDNMDFSLMGSFGVNKGKWGFLTDVIYMDLDDDDDVALDPVLTLTDVGIKAWIVTPIATYRVMQSDQLSLDLLAGARYLYMKADLAIDPLPRATESGSVIDGIVGIRGKVYLNERWYMPFHLDVGGGDTDSTWQAFTAVGYKFNSFDLIGGYRYLDWDFDDDDKGGGTFNDLNVSGPIIGVKFEF